MKREEQLHLMTAFNLRNTNKQKGRNLRPLISLQSGRTMKHTTTSELLTQTIWGEQSEHTADCHHVTQQTLNCGSSTGNETNLTCAVIWVSVGGHMCFDSRWIVASDVEKLVARALTYRPICQLLYSVFGTAELDSIIQTSCESTDGWIDQVHHSRHLTDQSGWNESFSVLKLYFAFGCVALSWVPVRTPQNCL